METIGGAVQLMFFIYGLAAVISLATALIIKLIFFAIQFQKTGTPAAQDAKTAPAKKTT